LINEFKEDTMKMHKQRISGTFNGDSKAVDERRKLELGKEDTMLLTKQEMKTFNRFGYISLRCRKWRFIAESS